MKQRESVGNYEPPPLRLEVGGHVRSPISLTIDELPRLGDVAGMALMHLPAARAILGA